MQSPSLTTALTGMLCGEDAADPAVAATARRTLLCLANGLRQGRSPRGEFTVEALPARPSLFALPKVGSGDQPTLVNNVKRLVT